MEVETIPSELVLGTTEDLKVDKLELADRLNSGIDPIFGAY